MQSLGILISQINAEYGDGGLYARTPHWNVYLVSPELVALGRVRTLYLSKRDINPPLELPEEPEKTRDWVEIAFNDLGAFPYLHVIFPGDLGE
jgi:hypothetical protein